MLQKLKDLIKVRLDEFCLDRVEQIEIENENERLREMEVQITGLGVISDLSAIRIKTKPKVLRDMAEFLYIAADLMESDAEDYRLDVSNGKSYIHWREGITPDIIVAWDFGGESENQ
jgi:hypothetical protein